MKKSMYFNYAKGVQVQKKAFAISLAGFDGTELFRFFDNREPLVEQFKAATDAGLAVNAVHADFCSTNDIWAEDESGDLWLDFLTKCVVEQAALGIPNMVVHVSRSSSPPAYNEIGLNRFRILCSEAEKHGVKIAFENLRRTDYLAFVLENIENAYFCLDCGHEFCWSKDEGVLEKYADRLLCVHLHDNLGDKDSHLLPFDGSLDWASLAARLAKTNRRFPLAAEVFCPADNYLQFPQRVYQSITKFEKLI